MAQSIQQKADGRDQTHERKKMEDQTLRCAVCEPERAYKVYSYKFIQL